MSSDIVKKTNILSFEFEIKFELILHWFVSPEKQRKLSGSRLSPKEEMERKTSEFKKYDRTGKQHTKMITELPHSFSNTSYELPKTPIE